MEYVLKLQEIPGIDHFVMEVAENPGRSSIMGCRKATDNPKQEIQHPEV